MSEAIHQVFQVASRRREGEAGVTLILDRELAVSPGRFVMVWLPGVEERPYSVMDSRPLTLTVAAIGPFSRALCALDAGERVWIRGPYGRGFDVTGESPVLVGGGSGTAALCLLAAAHRALGHDVVAVVGARTASLVMAAWRLEELGCHVITSTDDGTLGVKGTAIDALYTLGVQASRRLAFDALYGCGPEPMVVALARKARELELRCQVSLESTMKCGMGVCGTCHCGDRLVCHDGPVFGGEELLSLLACESII